MPYVQLELEAKKKMPIVAKSAGCGPEKVLWGLVELWEFVWATKRDIVNPTELRTCLGAVDGLPGALVEHGFLEPIGENFRARGAGRYLRVSRVEPKPPPPRKCPADPLASAEDFFAWVQSERVASGLVTEMPPHPARLSSWWSDSLMELNGDATRLQAAFAAYVRDPFWRSKSPRSPFMGFVSQWRKFVPEKKR